MGTLNLSRDSTYRESVAVSTRSAIRKARVQIAQGANVVDVGAESSTARAARVRADEQIARLLPVITEIAVETVVSVETYEPRVVEACLKSGARVLNMTGREHEVAMLELAAEYDAAVVLCFVELDNVRDLGAGRPGGRSDPGPGRPLRGAARDRRAARRRQRRDRPRHGLLLRQPDRPADPGPAPGEGARPLLPAPDPGRARLQRAAARVRPVRGGVPYGGGLLRGAGLARWHSPLPHPRGRARARRTHLDGRASRPDPSSRGGRGRSRAGQQVARDGPALDLVGALVSAAPAARGTTARPAARGCSPCRRGSAAPGRRSRWPSRRRTAWPSTVPPGVAILVDEPGRVEHQPAQRLDLDRGVGDHPLDGLPFGDRRSERDPVRACSMPISTNRSHAPRARAGSR